MVAAILDEMRVYSHLVSVFSFNKVKNLNFVFESQTYVSKIPDNYK